MLPTLNRENAFFFILGTLRFGLFSRLTCVLVFIMAYLKNKMYKTSPILCFQYNNVAMNTKHLLYYWALLMPAFAEQMYTEHGKIDSKLQGEPRIVGGQEAVEGRYPFAVSLVNPDGYHVCGGSLISSNIVLSAAHCNAGGVTHVQIGRADRGDINDEFETFSILHTIVYPLFDENSFSYDQMLCVMNGESTAATIRINRDPTVPTTGVRVITVGWGTTDENADYGSPVLMEASVFVESNLICNLSSSEDDSYSGLITPDMLCATDRGKDSCHGDSGGPLILAGFNTSDRLVGVTSWGSGCANLDFPGVYSRASFDPDWIDFHVCLYSKNSAPSDFLCDANTTTHHDDPFLTLEIQLDKYPEEVGWALMSSVACESRTDNTIALRTPPYYAPVLANELVTEPISIPAASACYTFIVSDSRGDGLCCAHGNGWYNLWKGPVENNELLASGDARGIFQEETAFALDFAPAATSTALSVLSLKCAAGFLAATIGLLLYSYS